MVAKLSWAVRAKGKAKGAIGSKVTPQVMWAPEGPLAMLKAPCLSADVIHLIGCYSFMYLIACLVNIVYTKAVQYAQSGM